MMIITYCVMIELHGGLHGSGDRAVEDPVRLTATSWPMYVDLTIIIIIIIIISSSSSSKATESALLSR